MNKSDVIVIGAGAAGMMCAAVAGARGRSVLVVDHAATPGEKIRISGGGRCNFTNRSVTPAQFLSDNPRFCISALSRYTPRDFIALVERYGIAYHEKTLGQLFCDGSAQQIIDLLLSEMRQAKAQLRLNCKVEQITKISDGFSLQFSNGETWQCAALVVATGGKSIPKMGASDFGYRLASQFGLGVTPTRAALVPPFSASLQAAAPGAKISRVTAVNRRQPARWPGLTPPTALLSSAHRAAAPTDFAPSGCSGSPFHFSHASPNSELTPTTLTSSRHGLYFRAVPRRR